LVLLESHTASSSAALNFTTGITSTYDEYVIEIINCIPDTNAVQPQLQVSTDGGATYDTGANYFTANFTFTATGSGSTGNSGSSFFDLADAGGSDVSSDSTHGGLSATCRLYDPLGTVSWKKFMAHSDWWHTSSVQAGGVFASAYKSTTAVNAFRFLFATGTIASGTVRLYGLAK
jgi:hypothetical protein